MSDISTRFDPAMALVRDLEDADGDLHIYSLALVIIELQERVKKLEDDRRGDRGAVRYRDALRRINRWAENDYTKLDPQAALALLEDVYLESSKALAGGAS